MGFTVVNAPVLLDVPLSESRVQVTALAIRDSFSSLMHKRQQMLQKQREEERQKELEKRGERPIAEPLKQYLEAVKKMELKHAEVSYERREEKEGKRRQEDRRRSRTLQR